MAQDEIQCFVTFSALVPSTPLSEEENDSLMARYLLPSMTALKKLLSARTTIAVHAVAEEIAIVSAERAALVELLSALGTSVAETSDRKLRFKSATHYPRPHPNDSPPGVSGGGVDVGPHMRSMRRRPAHCV